VHVVGGTDVHPVEPERLDDLVLHELRERATARTLTDLADQVPEGEAVIAGPLSRRMNRGGLLDRADHLIPVEHLARVIDHLADVVQARLVRENLADGDLLLARLRELRPVLGDPVLVVEQPLVHEDVQKGRGHALRGGEARGHGVPEPGISLVVPGPAPEIDHALAPVIDADGGPTCVGPEKAP
jgi:hypothetical protein